jgi:PPK2 family polyphosphate:nucleotide phosphotransferase
MSWKDHIRVHAGEHARLADRDTADRLGHKKGEAREALESLRKRLADLHELLWAENRRALLVVLQGMDTSGKDGTIRAVMRGVNPQGCVVTSFKQPSPEELGHDYLWRIHKAAPARGDIGIFNRSHYEDVLIARVEGLVDKETWKARYDQINHFERQLTASGTTILKFFLHISRDEQKRRLQARLDTPEKNWKFSEHDLATRAKWPQYMDAYEDAITRCSTEYAPWHIVPADRKWVRNLVISRVIVETLEGLNMHWPRPRLDLGAIRIE